MFVVEFYVRRMPRPLSTTEIELSELIVTLTESAKTCQGLVNGVVHNLEDQVVQTGTVGSISNVHTRPLSDRF